MKKILVVDDGLNMKELLEKAKKASPVQQRVMPWSIDDFKTGKVRIDFRDWTMPELNQLRKILKTICPDFEEPAYRFGPCYYCKNDRWYEGGHHQLKGELCRATEIKA